MPKNMFLGRNPSGSVGIKKFRCQSMRLGQGTSKIVVLPKQSLKFNEKSGFFCFGVDFLG